MGSFNIIGFQTNLPITRNEDVVILLGVKKKRSKRNEFSPGKIFTPIMLPMFGKYDDCGRPFMIEKDKNVWWLEEITATPIDRILEVLDNHEVGRWTNDKGEYERLIEPLMRYVGNNFDPKEDVITFIMDHKFLYTSADRVSDERWNHLKKTTTMLREMSPIERLGHYDRQLDSSLSVGCYYGGSEEHCSRLLMSLYHGEYDFLMKHLENEYRTFIGFFDWFGRNQWIMTSHSYGGQFAYKESLLPLYKEIVKYLEEHG